MTHENQSYWDEISKLTAQRDELLSILNDVLESWRIGESITEAQEIYNSAENLLNKYN